jgi:hypothetical protein
MYSQDTAEFERSPQQAFYFRPLSLRGLGLCLDEYLLWIYAEVFKPIRVAI